MKSAEFQILLATALLTKQFVGSATFQVCLELYEVAGPAGPYLIKLTVGHCFQMNIKSSCIKSVLCTVIAWCISIRSSAATILTRTWFSLCEFTHIIGLNFVLLCMCSKRKTWYQILKKWLIIPNFYRVRSKSPLCRILMGSIDTEFAIRNLQYLLST